MGKAVVSAFFAAALIGMASVPTATAAVVHTLGDQDFFGFGSGTIGDDVPSIDFDNNQAGDPSHTDRDIRSGVFGVDADNDVSFSHDLSALLLGSTVYGVELMLAIGGIQDGDQNIALIDTRVFIEGIEIIGAFDSLNQGAFGTDLITFQLNPVQVASFSNDFILDVLLDGGTVDFGSQLALESYFLDYTGVTAHTTIPLPASLPLMLAGVGLMCMLRRRRKG